LNKKLRGYLREYIKLAEKEFYPRSILAGARHHAKIEELQHIVLSFLVREYEKEEAALYDKS
jgi:hypothetical protein